MAAGAFGAAAAFLAGAAGAGATAGALGAGLGVGFFAQPENARVDTTKNIPKTNTVSFFKIYHLL
ncbi:MAG: hypothetical protein M0016_03830 [Deltaproteobacteria bacterium]|nr:hypothetical protein [Deltaproteobacteria bacterium]MDA8304277.1 hypothetical protein [Deltaproteobacteria bacterium]